jgi:hypothetical protein
VLSARRAFSARRALSQQCGVRSHNNMARPAAVAARFREQ